MGDTYQVIVDIDAAASESERLAKEIYSYMVARGIISAHSKQRESSKGICYPPGQTFNLAIKKPNPEFLSLVHNVLEIVTKRTVFYSASTGDPKMICDVCGNKFDPRPVWPGIINEWWSQNGPALISCDNCGNKMPLPEWKMEPQWGFGNLGFWFWNWPQLHNDFMDEIGHLLKHRVRYVYGKL